MHDDYQDTRGSGGAGILIICLMLLAVGGLFAASQGADHYDLATQVEPAR